MKELVSYVTLSFAAACLVGCGAEHVTALDEYWTQVSAGEPIPGDPWGACDLGWRCSNPEGNCSGWVSPGSCEGEGCEAKRLFIGCSHACSESGDCPGPQSGEASPACVDGRCDLVCDPDSACPSGYDCVARQPTNDMNTTASNVCMQVYIRADDG